MFRFQSQRNCRARTTRSRTTRSLIHKPQMLWMCCQMTCRKGSRVSRSMLRSGPAIGRARTSSPNESFERDRSITDAVSVFDTGINPSSTPSWVQKVKPPETASVGDLADRFIKSRQSDDGSSKSHVKIPHKPESRKERLRADTREERIERQKQYASALKARASGSPVEVFEYNGEQSSDTQQPSVSTPAPPKTKQTESADRPQPPAATGETSHPFRLFNTSVSRSSAG